MFVIFKMNETVLHLVLFFGFENLFDKPDKLTTFFNGCKGRLRKWILTNLVCECSFVFSLINSGPITNESVYGEHGTMLLPKLNVLEQCRDKYIMAIHKIIGDSNTIHKCTVMLSVSSFVPFSTEKNDISPEKAFYNFTFTTRENRYCTLWCGHGHINDTTNFYGVNIYHVAHSENDTDLCFCLEKKSGKNLICRE